MNNYRGISSLKEIECAGSTLPSEVTFLSLTLFKSKSPKPRSGIQPNLQTDTLASLLTSENTCHTYGQFSSCVIQNDDRRNSVVKTLVSDLKEGETITIGCTVNAVFIVGKNKMFDQTWTIDVTRESKF